MSASSTLPARHAARPPAALLRRLTQRLAAQDFAGLIQVADTLLASWPQSSLGHRTRALALIRLGRPRDAVAQLQEPAADAARNAESANLLGLASIALGEFTDARQALERALTIDRRYAAAWANLGTLGVAQGDRSGAARAFRRALTIDPTLADARCDFAQLLLDRGQKARARALLLEGAALPGAPAALYLKLAQACRSMSDRRGEVSAAAAAVSASPRMAAARLALANALLEVRQFDAALSNFRFARRLAPESLDAAIGLADTLRHLERHAAARGVLAAALRRAPDAPGLLAALVRLQLQRRQFAQALATAHRLIERAPRMAGAHFLMASAFLQTGDAAQAKQACLAGLAIDPAQTAGWTTLGQCHANEGRWTQALRSLHRALRLQRDNPAALFSLGLVALTLGDWATGFELYEWRWLGSSLGLGLPRPFVGELPWWGGDDLRGKRLLLLGEQGHGDNLQFARLIPLLRDPASLVLTAAAPVARLLRQSLRDAPTPVEVIDPAKAPHCGADAFVTLLSIPARVRLTQERLPPFQPWLRTDPTERAAWRERLMTVDQPRVGFVWRGNPKLVADHWRSTDLRAWEPLLRRRDVRWISLQKLEGACQAERDLLSRHGVIDWTDELHDFAATAALVENLDLVIAVDTSVAHLTGALGKPVWLLNRANSEWRWGWRAQTSPWYPGMRIFNQKTLLDWDPVLRRIARALPAFARACAE